MQAWQIVLAAALPAATGCLFIALCVLWLLRQGRLRLHGNNCPGDRFGKASGSKGNPGVLFSSGTREALHSNSVRQSSRAATIWRATYPANAFNWSDHPSLVAEAVEHGWAAFAFTYTQLARPIPPKLWNMCVNCSNIEPSEPEISWEVGAGTDYMQKMRLNPGLSSKRVTTVQALQASLPLPGPPLGPLSFPQETYFEITILAESVEYVHWVSFNDNEDVKLICPRLPTAKGFGSDAMSVYRNNSHEKREAASANKEEDEEARKEFEADESDTASMQARASEVGKVDIEYGGGVSSASVQQVCAVGLSPGAAPPFRLPGCDVGSIGFLSSGQLYLNGEEESKSSINSPQRLWGSINTTVGCGFDPAAWKIFFTLNGDKVLETTVSNDYREYFDHPLYPTIAANYDITLTANFGQTPFDYGPANSARIADPCFRRPQAKATQGTGGIEDSAELFSMGRINSQWLVDFASSSSRSPEVFQKPQPEPTQQLQPTRSPTAQTEGESDLFEIVLDSRFIS